MSDTSIAHTTDKPEQLESKIWACPTGCGYHIADGPTEDGEPSTDELISEHLEEHDEEHDLVDARGDAEKTAIVEEDAAERAEMEAEAAAEVAAEAQPEPHVANIHPERAAFTDGLRLIADWLDANPDVPLPYLDSTISGEDRPTLTILLGWWSGKDQREQMATIGRAMGQFAKYARPDGDRFAISHLFGSIAVTATAARDEVCERVVVGTHEVTEEVPDPEALAALPTVTVTKTVEEVEWVCSSLLSPEPRQLAAILTPDADLAVA